MQDLKLQTFPGSPMPTAHSTGGFLDGPGREEFQKGNLATAIAMWESLLAFDPDNVEVER